jgi:hypothetical protein
MHLLLLTPGQFSTLSLSSRSQSCLHAEISLVFLTGCQNASFQYLCKQKGILHRELNSTCLGSLYNQDYATALELCPFNIIPHQELVLQVQALLYLVYQQQMINSIGSPFHQSASYLQGHPPSP